MQKYVRRAVLAIAFSAAVTGARDARAAQIGDPPVVSDISAASCKAVKSADFTRIQDASTQHRTK
jgi:hypothetical protein